MSAPPDRPRAAPPARPLLVLTSLVLRAHVLMLQAAPSEWSAPTGARQTPPRPLVTRTIAIKPEQAPTSVAPAPALTRPPVIRPSARQAVSNRAPALAESKNIATETVADAATALTAPPASDAPAPPSPPAPVAAVESAAPPIPGARIALTIPGSVRLKYAMTGRSKNLDYSASAELDWLQDGQTYDAKMVVSALFLGARSMTSSGRITADGLAPTRFLDKSRSERAAHFEAEKGKIIFSANTPDAPWSRGAQDRLSVFMQLGSLLAGDPASHPAGSTLSLYTVGPREADTWVFTVGAPETLSLPIGQMAAIKLTRKPQRDYDQTVEIWFAPGMDYLPVRSRITQQNGDFVDPQLRGAEKP